VIELSRQAIVLSCCFRLVRFSAWIVARAIGPPVFHLARLSPQRIERDRSAWFVPDGFSLNDQRRRAVTSAIKPPRATSLAAQLGRDKRGIRHEPQTVITASSFHTTADEIAETLIFRAQISFQLAAGTTIYRRLTRWHQSDLVQRWVPNCPTSSSREFRLQARLHSETAAQIALEKIPEARVASPGTHL